MIHDLKPYPAYKDSGEPWLGQVPEHWIIRNLGSLTSATSLRNRPELPLLSVVREKGVIVRSTMRDDENHNFIPDDLKNYKVVREGNLVINKMKAWQGSLGIAPTDGIVSPAYYVFDIRIHDRHFAQALLRSKPYVSYFARASDGVRIGQWDLSIDATKRIPVMLPPPSEQSAIVRFLDHADRRIRRYIRAKKKLIALLNEQKQAIIHRAVTRGLDPNVRLKPSGVDWLGEVPEHWEVRKLRHCGRIEGGLTPSMEISEYWGGDIPWVTPKDMKRFSIDDSIARVTSAAMQKTSLRKLEAGAVLLVVRGMILARRVPIAWTNVEVTVNQDMKAILPRSGVCTQFLAHQLSSAQEAFRPLIDEAGHGTRRLPTERWRELPVALPPTEEQYAIVRFVNKEVGAIEDTVGRNTNEIDLLHEYRTRLIADVVTGKLDVREAAARLPGEAAETEPLGEDEAMRGDEVESEIEDLDALSEEAEA